MQKSRYTPTPYTVTHSFYLHIALCSATYHLLTAGPHGSRLLFEPSRISSTSAHEMIDFQYPLDLCRGNVALHDMVLIEMGVAITRSTQSSQHPETSQLLSNVPFALHLLGHVAWPFP